MCDVKKVYNLDADPVHIDTYEATWKEFKALLDYKINLFRQFVIDHSTSSVAKEELLKKESSLKTFLYLANDPEPYVTMAVVKYNLEKEYIEDQFSIYYKKTWLLAVIISGGNFFDISNKTRKRVNIEELEKKLNIPKYEQICLDEICF